MQTSQSCSRVEETNEHGFNHELGKTWIYPTNPNTQVRTYQKDIVHAALFQNTMVCLPTGLGKTFIAAVVMHNYYRWYPSGKIIFMATTKPLVRQQVDACYQTVAMPKECTAELTGNVLRTNRAPIWKAKRVFFLTPQVLLNDLETVPELGQQVRCVVVDEAHRARRNHSYCEVIRKLHSIHQHFRVLALTATPASSLTEVINVCHNLLISHLEVRTEDSADVVPYIHQRTFETVVIKLDGMLVTVIEKYKLILDKYVRLLVEHNILQSNIRNLHKGRLFYLSKEYEENNSHNRSTEEYRLIKKVFATCTILYHAYDLLLRHGLRSFLTFFEENVEKPLLIESSQEIRKLMTEIRDFVGPPLICDKLPNGSHLQLPANCKFGHPKFYRLGDLVRDHFRTHDASSKVIVFCEYQESVSEAYAMLLQIDGVKPKMFMGQSAITQKHQVNTISAFRRGEFNTLVSTCIGEEGIDVGFVDLVVCFDTSNRSSVRLVQRIGRTGRDRNGRVVVLVAEGREQQVLKECLHERQHLCSTLLKANGIENQLYAHNPRMLPEDARPECLEIFISAPQEKKGTPKLKNGDIRSFQVKGDDSSSFLLNSNSDDFTNFIPNSRWLCISNDAVEDGVTEQFNFEKSSTIQINLGDKSLIPSSEDSHILSDLLRFADYKRYNIPVPSKDRLPRVRQTDIRNIFKAPSTQKLVEVDKTLDEINFKLKMFLEKYQIPTSHENIQNNCKDLLINCLVPIESSNYQLSAIKSSNIKSLLGKFKESIQPNEYVNEIHEMDDHFHQATFHSPPPEEDNLDDSAMLAFCEELSQRKIVAQVEKSKEKITIDSLIDLSEFLDVSNIDQEPINHHIQQNGVIQQDGDQPYQHDNELQQNCGQLQEVDNDTHQQNYESQQDDDLNMSDDLFDDDFIPSKIDKSSDRETSKRKASPTSLVPIEETSVSKRCKFDVSDIFDLSEFEHSFIIAKSPTPMKPKVNHSRKILEQRETARISLGDLYDFETLPELPKKVGGSQTSNHRREEMREEINLQASPDLSQIALQKRKPTQKFTIEDIYSETQDSPIVKVDKPKTFAISDIMDLDDIYPLTPEKSAVPSTSSAPEATTPEAPKTYDRISDDETIIISPDSPVIARKKRPKQRFFDTIIDQQVADFIPDVGPSSSQFSVPLVPSISKTRSKTKPKPAREFICSQAEISDEAPSSDEMPDCSQDGYDESFVDDKSTKNANDTQMHAVYLQSIKSPKLRPLRMFQRSTAKRIVQDTIVDSERFEENTYVQDTFCVDSDEDDVFDEEMSELERAELKLAMELSTQEMFNSQQARKHNAKKTSKGKDFSDCCERCKSE